MADPKIPGADAGAGGAVSLTMAQFAEVVAAGVAKGVGLALERLAPVGLDEARRQREVEIAQAKAKAAIRPLDAVVAAGSRANAAMVEVNVRPGYVWHDGDKKVFGPVKRMATFGQAWGARLRLNEHDVLEATVQALKGKHAEAVTEWAQGKRAVEPLPLAVAIGEQPDPARRPYPPASHWPVLVSEAAA